MIELLISLIFSFSLSAWLEPSILLYITLASFTLLAIFNRNVPDTQTVCISVFLFLNFLVQIFFNHTDYNFELQITLTFFLIQNFILIGSMLSRTRINCKEESTIFKALNNLNKIFIVVLVFIPFVKMCAVLPAFGGTFPSELPSALGLLIFDKKSALGYDTYDSETLKIFPRLILSKSSYSLLLIYTGAWLAASIKSSTRCYIFLSALIYVSVGFRIAFTSISVILIISFLLRDGNSIRISKTSYSLRSFTLLITNIIIAIPFLTPFILLNFDKQWSIRAFDRLPSFMAALDYSINVNVVGASYGSYWKYTQENMYSLNRMFGENTGDVFLGTELFVAELLTSLGIVGTIVFLGYFLTRISRNISTMIIYFDSMSSSQKQLVFLQLGLVTASIGAATNLIGLSFFVIAGWKLNVTSSQVSLSRSTQ